MKSRRPYGANDCQSCQQCFAASSYLQNTCRVSPSRLMASNSPRRSGRESTLHATGPSLAGHLTRNIAPPLFWLAFLLSLRDPLKRRRMPMSGSTNLGDRDPARDVLDGVIECCGRGLAHPSGVNAKAVGTIRVKRSKRVAQSRITARTSPASDRLEAQPVASLGSGLRPARADDPWCHSTGPLDCQEPNCLSPIACFRAVAPCQRPNGALTHADRPKATSHLPSRSPIRGRSHRQPARSTASRVGDQTR